MPLSQIAVEIVVPDAPLRGNSARKNPVESPELRRALLQACSDTVQVAVCVNADSAHGAAALALVFWRGTNRVRIEVGSKDSPGGQTWTSREIEFSPRDAAVERWRAAGYAAGTLASLLIRSRGSKSAADAPEAPSSDESTSRAGTPAAAATGRPADVTAPKEQPVETAPPKAKPEPTVEPAKETTPEPPDEVEVEAKEAAPPRRPQKIWRWSFDAGAAVGPAVSANVLRTGGFVRVSRAFGGPFVTASFGYAEEKLGREGFSARWLSPTAGLGLVGALGSIVTLEGRAEFITERLEVVADGSTSEPYSTAYKWLVGARGGASFAWAPFDPIAIVIGGTASARGPAMDIVIRNGVRATAPVAAFAAEAGLRFTMP